MKILFINFIVLVNMICFGQTKSIKKNNIIENKIFSLNEYWSHSEGPASGISFENFYFRNNGTFINIYGYSGGIYFTNTITGRYTYDFLKGEIKLSKIKYSKKNTNYKIKSELKKITVKEINDSKITLIIGNENSLNINMGRKLFSRTVGTITNQCWYKEPNSSHDVIQFSLFGQAIIIQKNENKEEYVCVNTT